MTVLLRLSDRIDPYPLPFPRKQGKGVNPVIWKSLLADGEGFRMGSIAFLRQFF